MRCHHWDSGACQSCTWIETLYPTQLDRKVAAAQGQLNLLPTTQTMIWEDPQTSSETGFRTKVKLVVGGSPRRPTLGLLGPNQMGVDLPGCPIQHPAINEVTPALKRIIRALRLTPYDVRQRRGELKYIHITVGTNDQLMLRFVLRSRQYVADLREALPDIRRLIPNATVITANIHPRHEATVEGPAEVILSRTKTLSFRVGGVDLHLGPQSFSQTNSKVAGKLYQTVAAWVGEELRAPTQLSNADNGIQANAEASARPRIWDLYCGVGGFALHMATSASDLGNPAHNPYASPEANPRPHVTGVEVSDVAIQSAHAAARDMGLSRVDYNFIAADATEWARTQDTADQPDALIVNPPRRGLGTDLATWINNSTIPVVAYSSCNPVTLVQDLTVMNNYEAVRGRLFDMFPHTTHAEVAVLLRRIPT